jgi:hypothetical protein
MEKKVVIFGSIIVVLAGVIFLIIWRSHIMGPGARVTAGGLVAVSSEGTPMPIPVAQATAGKLPEDTAIQESGGLVVSLTLNPYPPSVSKSSEFEITLTDANGQAISDATISLDLTMPGMYMPPNLLNLEPSGEGKYLASGRFTMRGPWRMEAIITIGGKTQSVFFDVWL